jgi:hypothetical protein
MTCTERQTNRAHGPSQYRDQGRCAQEAKEPTLGPSPAYFRGHLTAPIDANLSLLVPDANGKLQEADCTDFTLCKSYGRPPVSNIGGLEVRVIC